MKNLIDYIKGSDLEKKIMSFLSSSDRQLSLCADDSENDVLGSETELCSKHHIKELVLTKSKEFDSLKDKNTNNRTLYITDIMVSDKNKGYGSEILKTVIKCAEKKHFDIALHPDSMFGSDLDRLVRFYEKNGFVTSNKAVDKNIKIDGQYYIMFRYC